MLIIGLTGPSGSGKSVVASVFTEHGCRVIDADKVYHDLLIPPSDCLEALRKEFGDKILNTDGTLDRAMLGGIVFNDKNKLETLNRITHKFVLDETQRIAQIYMSEGTKAVVFDAPLLIESGFNKKCDFTICVTASVETRLQRIMSRDGIDREKALLRINAQPDDSFYINNTNCHLINDSIISDITEKCEVLISSIGL